MTENYKFTQQIRRTGFISLPLIGSRILNIASGFISMVLIARLGIQAMAASALIVSTSNTILLTSWALLYSAAVLIGRAYGSEQYETIGEITRASCFVSLVWGGLITFVIWHVNVLLTFLHQPPDLVSIVTPYFHILSLGIIPSLLVTCFQELALGINRSYLVIAFTAITTTLNITLSYCLIFGVLGFPRLGIYGVACAYAIDYWITAILMAMYLRFSSQYKVFKFFAATMHNLFSQCKSIIKIGWPISLQLGAIAASFSFLTYMMGWLGKNSLAAHHIVNQWEILIIMIPYGIAQASSVLVAQAVGAKRRTQVAHLGYAGAVLSASLVLIVSLSYWLLPDSLISLYISHKNISNIDIVTLAAYLMAIMGIIQVIDSIGITITGALRGLHDTFIPMLISLGVNWLINIPLAYTLAFTLKFGAVGIYIGFAIGTFCSALLLTFRFRQLARNPY